MLILGKYALCYLATYSSAGLILFEVILIKIFLSMHEVLAP